jgi:hypothetical protein
MGKASSSEFPNQMKIVKGICSRKDLLEWCRAALNDPRLHGIIIESAIGILCGAMLFGKDRKNVIIPIICGLDQEGRDDLFESVLSVLENRRYLAADTCGCPRVDTNYRHGINAGIYLILPEWASYFFLLRPVVAVVNFWRRRSGDSTRAPPLFSRQSGGSRTS